VDQFWCEINRNILILYLFLFGVSPLNSFGVTLTVRVDGEMTSWSKYFEGGSGAHEEYEGELSVMKRTPPTVKQLGKQNNISNMNHASSSKF
jgi:hypothetical protein